MNQNFLKTIDCFDQQVLTFSQGYRHHWLTKLFIALTYTGTGRAWAIYAIVLNLFHFAGAHLMENQTEFLRSMFAPLLAWVLGSVIKKRIDRARPSPAISGSQPLIPSPTCGSFPSSHTAAALAFFAALLLIGHPLAAVIGVWALLVSFSRLYLGVHYLSDVLGGVLLGVVSAVVVVSVAFGGHFGS